MCLWIIRTWSVSSNTIDRKYWPNEQTNTICWLKNSMNVIENIVTTNWPYRADFEHKVLKPGALRRDLWGFKQSQIGAFDLLRPLVLFDHKQNKHKMATLESLFKMNEKNIYLDSYKIYQINESTWSIVAPWMKPCDFAICITTPVKLENQLIYNGCDLWNHIFKVCIADK